MEHVRFERLADDAIATAIFEPLQIHVQGVARASYDGRGIAQVTNGFGSVRAVQHRHDKIHQDSVVSGQTPLLDSIHGNLSVFGFFTGVTNRFQRLE